MADATGYGAGKRDGVGVADNTRTTGMDVSLTPGGSLSGLVRDETSGQPIENASLSTNGLDFVDFPFTDATGNFIFSHLASGLQTFTVKAEGYLDKEFNATIYSRRQCEHFGFPEQRGTHLGHPSENRWNTPGPGGTGAAAR